MSTPEIIKPTEQPVVTEHQTDFDPTPQMVEQGITSTPSQATATTVQINDQQQVTVNPVPAPASAQTITIPSDQKTLEKQSHGSAEESSTWSAFFWLRALKKALKQGLQVMVGGKQNV